MQNLVNTAHAGNKIRPDEAKSSKLNTPRLRAGNPLLQPQNWTRNKPSRGCTKNKMWNAWQLSNGPAAMSSQQVLVSFLCRLGNVQRSECSNPSVSVPYIYVSEITDRRRIEEWRSTTSSVIRETHPKIGDRQQSGIYPFSGSQFRLPPFNQ